MLKSCYAFLIFFLIIQKSFQNEEIYEEININTEQEQEYAIKSNTSYIFTIANDSYVYSFISYINNIFYIKNENNSFEVRPNETFFEKDEKIYVNHLKTLGDTKIKIISFLIHTEFNSFQTIKENQYFFIRAGNKSIAYFDSFDKNSKVYISESRQKNVIKEDIRINGKFKEIEPNHTYLIKNEIFNFSVFKRYFKPIYTNESHINIIEDDTNFFYLNKDCTYFFNFQQSLKNIILKLSSKTFNSKIIIKNNENSETKELNQNSPYYILDKNFKGNLTLNINENDAFIELLFNYGDYEVLTDEKKQDYKINKNIEIIKLPLTQKSFEIKLKSKNIFKYSISLGLSNNENYFYSSKLNSKINSNKDKEEILTYISLYKDINILKEEFISITINIEKEEENNDIFLTYSQYSLLDEIIDEKLEPEKCQEIIKVFKELFEYYVYLDIAQNPPDIGIPNYHHRKINIIEEIGNIYIYNRTFYEFYQEILSILTVVKDFHISIVSTETPKGIQFYEYSAVLPLRYTIKSYNNEPRVFITIREEYIDKYDNYTQEMLRSHLDIPIKSINDMDPIDYIQNWSRFIVVKNIHSNFVQNLHYMAGFYMHYNPLNYSDFVANELEFDDNKIIRLSYYIIKPEINDAKFKQFFVENLKKYNNARYMPSIEELKDIFYHKKKYSMKNENKDVNKETKIKWDVEYKDNRNYFKCRVDHGKSVNVVTQNSFSFDFDLSVGHIFKCSELFHSNEYPIIIIEDRNNGGDPNLAYFMIQLFQMREVERTYSAIRYKENFQKYFNLELEYKDEYVYNPDTCENIYKSNEFYEVSDYYNYSGLNITHKRTNVFVELCPLNRRKAFNSFREKYKDSPYLKKPTDIIIFTDSFSFSSGSTFIKGFQNIGGAILVGYLGNPKIEGIDLFDASQSDSGVNTFENTDISEKLEKLGFVVSIMTFIEVFDDSYQAEFRFPREYKMVPVDYRVDIYSFYSDDVYD